MTNSTTHRVDSAYDAGFAAGVESGLLDAIAAAGSSTRPLPGHGTMNEGSRSTWYAHGIHDAAERVRRLLAERRARASKRSEDARP